MEDEEPSGKTPREKRPKGGNLVQAHFFPEAFSREKIAGKFLS
jgi:hypothetical protein